MRYRLVRFGGKGGVEYGGVFYGVEKIIFWREDIRLGGYLFGGRCFIYCLYL